MQSTVMTMLDALLAYLSDRGYTNICLDAMPAAEEQRDAIALYCYKHKVGDINDGTGTRRIQIQVRRETYTDARAVCMEIFRLLDSGTEEKLLRLTPESWCIARPQKGPLKLEAGTGYVTFYCETALWGQN